MELCCCCQMGGTVVIEDRQARYAAFRVAGEPNHHLRVSRAYASDPYLRKALLTMNSRATIPNHSTALFSIARQDQ